MWKLFFAIVVTTLFLQDTQQSYLVQNKYSNDTKCSGPIAYFEFLQLDVCFPPPSNSIITQNGDHYTFSLYSSPNCTGYPSEKSSDLVNSCENYQNDSYNYYFSSSLQVSFFTNSYQFSHYPSCTNITTTPPLSRVVVNNNYCMYDSEKTSYLYITCTNSTYTTRTFRTNNCTGTYFDSHYPTGNCSLGQVSECYMPPVPLSQLRL